MVTFSGYVVLYRGHKKDSEAGLPGAVQEKRDARAGMKKTSSELRDAAALLYDQMHLELAGLPQ